MGPSPCGQTDVTKNMTIPQLRWRTVNIVAEKLSMSSMYSTAVKEIGKAYVFV